MAEEPVVNPCCAKWIAKRNALREAVKLLNQWKDQIEAEKLTISKALEDERARVEAEKEARVKESAVRVELENEILQLKSEINYIQDTACSRSLEITEREGEIKRLKELLEEEKKRGDDEKRKAEVEKRKAAKALRLLKSRLDGENQLIDKDVIQDQVSDGVDEINRLKELLAIEKKSAEAEKNKALEALQLLESEKNKGDGEKKMDEMERNQAEELKITLEALRSEAKKAGIKLGIEIYKNEEAQKKLEVQKNKAKKEKKRANSEKVKAELQKRCAEEERKKLLDEKNELSRRLEEEQKRSEELEKKVQDIMNPEKLENVCPEESDREHETEQFEKERPKKLQKKEFVSATELENLNAKAANANMLFLEKQLEHEKKHVKHAKKVAKFEKRRNDLLHQEISRLKQDLHQFHHRLNLLDGCFSDAVGGIDASAKGT